jgi:hypothetical protein
MHGVTSLPLWAVALVLAALAPFGAKLLVSMFERHARQRSRRVLTALGGIPDRRGPPRATDQGSEREEARQSKRE